MPTRLHRRVFVALRSFVRRRAVEHELDDELRFHLEQLEADPIARGSERTRAHLEAQRRFGGLDQVKEACRDMRALRPLEIVMVIANVGADVSAADLAAMVEHARAVPGVVEVATIERPLLPLERAARAVVSVSGKDTVVPCSVAEVSPDYFRTLQLPIVAGRAFDNT